jgi:hypothetical protein
MNGAANMMFKTLMWIRYLLTKRYLIVKPSGHPPWNTIIVFHGHGQTPQQLRAAANFDAIGEATNSIVVYLRAPCTNHGQQPWKPGVRVIGQIHATISRAVSGFSHRDMTGPLALIGHRDGGGCAIWYGMLVAPSAVVAYAPDDLWDSLNTANQYQHPLLLFRGHCGRATCIAKWHEKQGHRVVVKDVVDGRTWDPEAANQMIIEFLQAEFDMG